MYINTLTTKRYKKMFQQKLHVNQTYKQAS